jgi:hypothetical protein
MECYYTKHENLPLCCVFIIVEMKLHQRQFILVVSSRYNTGFRGLDNLKDKQNVLVVLTNSIGYSFYFHQAAPGETFPDDLTPLDVYMPVIGKCL